MVPKYGYKHSPPHLLHYLILNSPLTYPLPDTTTTVLCDQQEHIINDNNNTRNTSETYEMLIFCGSDNQIENTTLIQCHSVVNQESTRRHRPQTALVDVVI